MSGFVFNLTFLGVVSCATSLCKKFVENKQKMMQQKPSDLIPTRVGQKRPKLIGDFGTLIFIMAMVAHVAISGSVTLESPSAAAVLLSPVLFSAFPAVHQNRARVLLGNSRKMKNKNKTENRKLGHNNNVTLSWIPKISSEKREKKEHIQDSDFDFFTIQKSHPIHQFQNGEQKMHENGGPAVTPASNSFRCCSFSFNSCSLPFSSSISRMGMIFMPQGWGPHRLGKMCYGTPLLWGRFLLVWFQ